MDREKGKTVTYLVTWEMEIEVDDDDITTDSPLMAAQRAWETIRRHDSTAGVFTVEDISTHERWTCDVTYGTWVPKS